MMRTLLVTLTLLLALAAPAGAAPIVVDGNYTGRTFDGVGAVSAGASSRLLHDYPEPERSQVLDYLFKPGYGASLQLLKVEIGADANSTSGSEASHMRTPDRLDCDAGYEWWLMKEAKRRNPDIKLLGLEWGAPAWFEGGFWSQDNIDYLLDWLDCADRHGLEIDYMGGWNERGFDAGWYVEWARALERSHPDVQIVAADECCRADLWRVADALAADPAFKAAVDVVGVHFACGNREARRTCSTTDTARGLGLPLWSSENSSMSRHVGAEPIARALNRSYIDADMTGFMSWSAVSAWYASLPLADTGLITAEWPWSGFYDVGRSVWANAHTTQFAQPGWRYVDGASARDPSGATYVTRVSPSGDDYSIVIEGMDLAAPATLEFAPRNLPAGPLTVWDSDLRSADRRDHMRDRGTVAPRDGAFSVTIEPGHVVTVTTTTGQRAGRAEPRADVSEQLRLPFREDFDDHGSGELARYFSDVNGGFETARCGGGRDGMCLRQVVPERPISWNDAGGLPPTSVAGDPRWWGDYEVGADVLFEQADDVELLGRVESHGGTRVSGYHFALGRDGGWRVYGQDRVGDDETLAAGSVALDDRRWHRLALRFRGNRIEAFVDGRRVAGVEDDRHRSGQIGLRTDTFDHAQFDDVRVTPTAAAPAFVPQGALSVTATSEHPANDGGYEHSVGNAIDGRPETMWTSALSPQAPLPQSVTLRLDRRQRIGGLTYQPRLDGSTRGMVTEYEVQVSDDGSTFERVAAGTWPLGTGTKVVSWPERPARYVRFVVTGSGSCAPTGIAAASELRVVRGRGLEPTGDAGDSGPGFDGYVPHERIGATATSMYGPGFEPALAVDGDCRTFWHTAPGATQPLPAALTLDLDGEWDVEGITYLPRQDGNGNGLITSYAVAVSADGASWTRVASGTWPADPLLKAVRWPATPARHLRLEVLGGTANVGSVSELQVGVAGGGP